MAAFAIDSIVRSRLYPHLEGRVVGRELGWLVVEWAMLSKHKAESLQEVHDSEIQKGANQ